MKVLAGTSGGVYEVQGSEARPVLEGGAVRDLAQVGARAFAGTADGLFVSSDAGASWSLAGLPEHEIWQVRAASDGALYAATAPAGLFRSADGGETWTEVETFSGAPQALSWGLPAKPPLPGRARALVIDAQDPRRLFVGVEVGGVMRSEDGGETWTLNLPGGNPDLHMMYAHPEHPEMLFASTGYGRLDGVAEHIEGNAGVFRSDDHGATWHYAWKGITPRYSRPMCIDPRTPFGLTVASAPTAFSRHEDEGGANAMLFRSVDGGESWRSLCDDAHSPSTANFHGLNVDPERPGGVVVGTDTGEVWRVSDDAKWTMLAAGMPSVLAVLAG